MTALTYTAQCREQADAVLDDVVASMNRTGHTVTIGPPSFPEPGEDDGRLYVNGDKSAACGRCALVHVDGRVDWVF
jgi:hypothetical protein